MEPKLFNNACLMSSVVAVGDMNDTFTLCLCRDVQRFLSLCCCAKLAALSSPYSTQGKDLSDAELQVIMTVHDLDHNGVFDEVRSADYSLQARIGRP